VEQSDILYGHLLLLECLTLAVVIGIVALKFRSFIAPFVALLTAALSYFLAVRVTNYVGGLMQQGGAPEELKPLVLALVPPAACRRGSVAVHVEQRSTGRVAVVEFSLDAAAAGPGCYVVA